MVARAYVQVATDGTGKKIANLAVTEPTAPDASGNATADTTTYQQLVTLADDRGDISDPWPVVYGLLADINTNLALILEALG